jgi:hypothetical protein
MVMRNPAQSTSRFLLAYFIESKIWKSFLEAQVNNYVYWVNEDPNRARRMMEARSQNKKGYTMAEHIYDMIDCVHSSQLKSKTKQRLYNELDELERWHEFMGTLELEL